MIGRLLSPPRANIVDLGRNRGDDMVKVLVRAGSKTGAIVTARVEAMKSIPLREQNVEYVEQLDNSRFFNKWEVDITDQESMEPIGE